MNKLFSGITVKGFVSIILLVLGVIIMLIGFVQSFHYAVELDIINFFKYIVIIWIGFLIGKLGTRLYDKENLNDSF